jgi:hypothetical protein
MPPVSRPSVGTTHTVPVRWTRRIDTGDPADRRSSAALEDRQQTGYWTGQRASGAGLWCDCQQIAAISRSYGLR